MAQGQHPTTVFPVVSTAFIAPYRKSTRGNAAMSLSGWKVKVSASLWKHKSKRHHTQMSPRILYEEPVLTSRWLWWLLLIMIVFTVQDSVWETKQIYFTDKIHNCSLLTPGCSKTLSGQGGLWAASVAGGCLEEAVPSRRWWSSLLPPSCRRWASWVPYLTSNLCKHFAMLCEN